MCQKAEMKINLPFVLIFSQELLKCILVLLGTAQLNDCKKYFTYHQFTKSTTNCLQQTYIDSKKLFPSNQVYQNSLM